MRLLVLLGDSGRWESLEKIQPCNGLNARLTIFSRYMNLKVYIIALSALFEVRMHEKVSMLSCGMLKIGFV